MSKAKMIVVVGHSGAGKSTACNEYAKEHDFALICEDNFVFDMNPASYSPKIAAPTRYHREIGMKNMKSVVENYMKDGVSVIIEGAMVDGPIYLNDWREMAECAGYEFSAVMFKVDRKAHVRRKSKQVLHHEQVLPIAIDERLKQSAEDLGYSKECKVIDTTKLSKKAALEALSAAV